MYMHMYMYKCRHKILHLVASANMIKSASRPWIAWCSALGRGAPLATISPGQLRELGWGLGLGLGLGLRG